MIITITMNPSVDISYPLEVLTIDNVNRVAHTRKTPGGKGLNVTRVLHELNETVLASGLLGGKLGEFIEEKLTERAIQHSFYKITNDTRNCIAILHNGKQTEILEDGPTISENEKEGFLAHFSQLIDGNNIITISGSLPKGLPANYYAQLIDIATIAEVPVLLDSSGAPLKAALLNDNKPFLIKPNQDELANLLGREITTIADLKIALQNPLFTGVEWIVVSLGGDGAFAKHGDIFYKVDIPEIEVISAVGSGDSTVAGLATAINNAMFDEDILKFGMTAGMLNTQEEITGHINTDNFEELYDKIVVRKLK